MVHSYLDGLQAIVPAHINTRGYRPGRRTILVSVSLSFLLLMAQIFCSFNLSKPSKLSFHMIHKSVDALNEAVELPPCLKNFLGNHKPPAKAPDTCHYLTPPRGFCSLTQELFYDNSPETCSHQKEVQFCKMWKGNIKCNEPEECRNSNIYTGVFDHESGETTWEEIPFSNLENKLQSLAQRSYYKGYIFIKCSDKSFQNRSNEGDFPLQEHNKNEDPIQLFLYPKISKFSSGIPRKEDFMININMVMIDSLSRNHLFRSLPLTVDLLDKLKDGSRHTVIDFSYIQSLKQRTYENLQALFSGFVNIYDKPFGTQSTPDVPLSFEVLFGKFKSRGYQTLWLEDLCWKWEWGLPRDLRVVNKTLSNKELWFNFQKALRNAMIDDVDVTLASCDILKANDKNDPFQNTPSVCFNGKYHHEYILEYLQLYQRQQQNRRPFFTFAQTNVAHDETGVRVQSLDISLRRYLEYAQSLEDTITVLFSDHGNVYGTFLEKSPEAYVEIFNPFLIFIIPNGVARAIGKTKVQVMLENSQHLVSLLDVHYTLLVLLNESNVNEDEYFQRKFVIPNGLFSNIYPKRTCHDLPLIMPNLCICRDFEAVVDINDFHYAYSEFSLGVINNLILRERFKNGQKGFGKCQLLQVKRVRSVRELRKAADITQFKLDVEVTGVLSSEVELFFFTVEVGSVNPSLRLLSFERNSVYGKYRSCKDDNVDLKMCSCEGEVGRKKLNILNIFFPDFFTSIYSNSYKDKDLAKKQIKAFFDSQVPYAISNVDKKYPEKNPCLFIVRHQYGNSFNVFGLNICSSFQKVTLKVTSENLYLSDNSISSYLLHPLDVKHLIGGAQSNLNLSWRWDYDIIIV